jgi:hypothetical protein
LQLLLVRQGRLLLLRHGGQMQVLQWQQLAAGPPVLPRWQQLQVLLLHQRQWVQVRPLLQAQAQAQQQWQQQRQACPGPEAPLLLLLERGLRHPPAAAAAAAGPAAHRQPVLLLLLLLHRQPAAKQLVQGLVLA